MAEESLAPRKAKATTTATAKEERLAFGRAVAPSARRLLAELKLRPSGFRLGRDAVLWKELKFRFSGLKVSPTEEQKHLQVP